MSYTVLFLFIFSRPILQIILWKIFNALMFVQNEKMIFMQLWRIQLNWIELNWIELYCYKLSVTNCAVFQVGYFRGCLLACVFVFIFPCVFTNHIRAPLSFQVFPLSSFFFLKLMCGTLLAATRIVLKYSSIRLEWKLCLLVITSNRFAMALRIL